MMLRGLAFVGGLAIAGITGFFWMGGEREPTATDIHAALFRESGFQQGSVLVARGPSLSDADSGVPALGALDKIGCRRQNTSIYASPVYVCRISLRDGSGKGGQSAPVSTTLTRFDSGWTVLAH